MYEDGIDGLLTCSVCRRSRQDEGTIFDEVIELTETKSFCRVRVFGPPSLRYSSSVTSDEMACPWPSDSLVCRVPDRHILSSRRAVSLLSSVVHRSGAVLREYLQHAHSRPWAAQKRKLYVFGFAKAYGAQFPVIIWVLSSYALIYPEPNMDMSCTLAILVMLARIKLVGVCNAHAFHTSTVRCPHDRGSRKSKGWRQ
jgi:hypothetical protein